MANLLLNVVVEHFPQTILVQAYFHGASLRYKISHLIWKEKTFEAIPSFGKLSASSRTIYEKSCLTLSNSEK